MDTNKKFTIGLFLIVIVMVFGIVLLSAFDADIVNAQFHWRLFPIILKSDVEDRPYPLPTYPPTPHPYPSPTPTQIPILNQYIPILFNSILGNLIGK